MEETSVRIVQNYISKSKAAGWQSHERSAFNTVMLFQRFLVIKVIMTQIMCSNCDKEDIPKPQYTKILFSSHSYNEFSLGRTTMGQNLTKHSTKIYLHGPEGWGLSKSTP